ncbi:HAD-IA family hydrolase [Streptomyces sp. MS19]|uniref:HAD-IA family hydrolase n=1 Tax=Streptomyces sp. MS19 TaxID=3385972 RepID=UPI0039A04033
MLRLTVTDRGTTRRLECAAVLFDMDGTLVDSSRCVERTWLAWCARHGIDSDALFRVSHGRRNRETVALMAPHLPPPEVEREIAALVRAEEACRDGIAAVPGARRVLAALPADRWAVVTSAWRRLAEIRLRAAGLPEPRVLVTADDVTAGKPDPEGYLRAAASLGAEPARCLVVEDAPAGLAAARAAGMRTLALRSRLTAGRPHLDLLCDDLTALRHEGAG